jgi:hypothetical protein
VNQSTGLLSVDLMPPKPKGNPLRQAATAFREIRDRHEERHRPSDFNFAFADRVDFLNCEAWDSVTRGGNLFLRRAVLKVVERHGPENLEPRYAIIFHEEKPVAVVAAQIVRVTGKHLHREKGTPKPAESKNLLKRVLKPAARLATAKLDERLLVAGNLMSWGFHGIAFAPGEKPAQIWPGVADALYRIRRANRLMGDTNLVMVKDVTDNETGLEALRRFSYQPLETEPNMVLTLNPAWGSYDGYLSALDAKYRRNAKDQLKKLSAAGCTIESLKGLTSHSKRLHELFLSVHHNASVRLVTLTENYLPQLAAALGEDFRCTIIRRGEHLLGFVTTLRDGPTAIAYYIGFDRAAAA